ncbi:hypothetical protein LPJ73_000381, partial [Coemansia sp. RSA 2703]
PAPPAYGQPEPTVLHTVTETHTSTSTAFVDTTSDITVTQTIDPSRNHGHGKKHGGSKPQGNPHVAFAGAPVNPWINPAMPANPWIKPVPVRAQANARLAAAPKPNGPAHSNDFLKDVGFFLKHGAAPHNPAHRNAH